MFTKMTPRARFHASSALRDFLGMRRPAKQQGDRPTNVGLAHQTAFPDARWPHETYDRAVALNCTAQQALDGGQLPPPTHQIRLSALSSAIPTCSPTAV